MGEGFYSPNRSRYWQQRKYIYLAGAPGLPQSHLHPQSCRVETLRKVSYLLQFIPTPKTWTGASNNPRGASYALAGPIQEEEAGPTRGSRR